MQVAAVAANNPITQGLPMGGCGICLSISCANALDCGPPGSNPSQNVTVYVADTCTDCGANDLSVQPLAFQRIARLSLGQVPVVYSRVDCEPDGDILVRVDANRETGGGWTRLTIQNVGGGGLVTSASLSGPGDTTRQDTAVPWEAYPRGC